MLKEWEAKVTVTHEARDLTKLSIEEFIGSLMTHDLNIHQKEKEEDSKKKKTIAFKSTTKFKESDESKDEDEEKNKDENEDFKLLTRKFKSFLRRNG